MLWKLNGKVMKTPSSYDDDISDTDKDSYTSAMGMLSCSMSWDYLTEEEAEELLQATYKNPMIVTIKVPSIPGGILEDAKFRVSKRQSKMHITGVDEDATKSKWQVSFSMEQKELTEAQKQAVEEANSNV